MIIIILLVSMFSRLTCAKNVFIEIFGYQANFRCAHAFGLHCHSGHLYIQSSLIITHILVVRCVLLVHLPMARVRRS